MMTRKLTEKENCRRALSRTGTLEWVPIVNDAMAMVFSSEVHERPAAGADGDDWFGCHWHWDADCLGFAPDLHKPLALDDVTKWRDIIQFPSLDSIDWQAAAARDLAEIDREEKFVRFFMESGPLERSHALLGFEGAFTAMYDEPEAFKELVSAITDYKVKLLGYVCQYYQPDDVFAQDDLGTNSGPMLSLTMYREFFKPAHIRISEAIRQGGAIHTHHSCGCMQEFVDDLLEVGAQVLNPMQACNNRKSVVAKYADRVSFDVGIDGLACRNDATEEQIRAEAREIIDLFAPHSNTVLMAFPTNASVMGNYDIALDEARVYGGAFYGGLLRLLRRFG